ASEPLGDRSSGQKSRRSPLQTLYEGDQVSVVQPVIHQGRREVLEEACRSYTRKRRVLIPEDLKHVIVDDQHGLLYCYVPKVACTNWKRVLMVLTGVAGSHQDPLSIPANEAHVPGNLRTLSEYSTSQINQRLRSYLKFVFVREPFERLVSAYRNKFTRSYNTAFHKRYGTKIVQRHRPNPEAEALERGNDVSFEEFVYYLVDPATQREEPFNEHWERVHSLCHPASSTTMLWGNMRRWSRTPAMCCSWPEWRTRSASLPRPKAQGLLETWRPSSSKTSAPSTRKSSTTSIAWTSCSSTTLFQPTSSLDEAGTRLKRVEPGLYF
uniref:Carbohydrate sulfotransferase n=1 Tax=Labrus bergylta TaxID=56723 RepID=A0A3Q3L6K5_9LABR